MVLAQETNNGNIIREANKSLIFFLYLKTHLLASSVMWRSLSGAQFDIISKAQISQDKVDGLSTGV